ncbi:hypothetical protein QBC35DRAFT_439442 [Podospora australis]|uniref:DUF1479 domain protein n=1 Tax=Podospora australis TaxID=1536484 RepID=A0AAN6WP65_9PEZI|nr:hypothetical protein QBC35DRAFT_439442 [Podospora australis]
MAGSVSGAAVSVSTRASSTITSTTTTTAATIMTTTEKDVVMGGMGGGGAGISGGINPNGIDKGALLEPRARCSQCGRRRAACHHPPPAPSPSITNGTLSAAPLSPPPGAASAAGAGAAAPLHNRPRRISKLKHRLNATFADPIKTETLPAPLLPVALNNGNHYILSSSSFSSSAAAGAAAAGRLDINSSSYPPNHGHHSGGAASAMVNNTMEPPVLSFYGKEPVPLPTRFAHIKRSLVAGHEAALEASWARLIEALKDEVEEISSRGSHITPSIDFADIDDPASKAAFARDLKRYGLGLVRGVVPRTDAQVTVDETVKYLEKQSDFKEPAPQDPTCFDFFWTPAQVRTRAHPRVLQAQKFAMSLWDNDADDRMAIRFPIAYADRLRIHGANIGGVGPDGPADKGKKKAEDDTNGAGSKSTLSNEQEAEKAALELELMGDFASSTVIAQVDNGSLERWEPDGYGRGGTYQAVFNGEWEKYDPWDPTFRVSATSDLYNGYGACSIFRMYQGVVALSTIEPGLIRLLPSPKLATAYFLLRPFFSPKTKAPERRSGPEWEAFLDPSNWALDKEQSTIIHGAVPGHAQRLTELWHPHLHLRKTLVTIPTLQTGDYIVWHPDLAYHITSNPNVMASRAPSPPPGADSDSPPTLPVSILVYVPAAPLTQNNCLYLARQRKTFQRGHPGPDFDSTGSGVGTEATHIGRFGETEIAEVGGPAGLQAMGLAPFDVAPTPPTDTANGTPSREQEDEETDDVNMNDAAAAASSDAASSVTRAEAEVARLANIILFPDRYDFYMARPKAGGRKRSRAESDGDHAVAASSVAAAEASTTESRDGSAPKEEADKGKEDES